MKPVVSIIVPVYQVEAYLARCLDSLLVQTYEHCEIVVVEDGSKDGSKSIVQDYEKKYPGQIKAIYQTNQGLSAARNHGIRISTGDYIAFVDSDDYVSADMIETMVAAMADGVSIVETIAYFAYDDKKPQIKPYQTKQSISQEAIAQSKGSLLELALTAHSKLYRRELVEAIEFPLGLVHEDVYFTQLLYPHIKSVVKLNQGGYFHYQRSDSITNTYNQKIYDMLAVQQRVAKEFQLNGHWREYQSVLERNAVRTLVISTIGRKMGCLKPEFHASREDYHQRIKDFIKTTYPNYQNNRYLSSGEKMFAKTLLANPLFARLCWTIGPKVIKR